MSLGFLKSEKFWIGVGSFAAGIFAVSKAGKKLAVNTVAAGMKAKDCVMEGWSDIKEEASDIYEEAKKKNAPCD